ncbi:MAG: TatD family hydrolase [Sedimenticola sp.]
MTAAAVEVPDPSFVVTLDGFGSGAAAVVVVESESETQVLGESKTRGLSESKTRAVARSESQTQSVTVRHPRLPAAFDSHFHLDRTRNRLGVGADASLATVLRRVPPPSQDAVDLVGAVAVFCDPQTYPTEAEVRDLVQQGLTIAVGVHPKGANLVTNVQLRTMELLLQLPEVIGMGEVGLDHTSPRQEWSDQINLIRDLGHYIKDRHVLILHCRRDDTVEQDHRVYDILLKHLRCSVGSGQQVHLHCFNGDAAVVSRWMDKYPNTYFGFTRGVDSFRRDQLEGLRAIDDDRLLIETDAPYFQFRGLGRYSTPALIGLTAKAVARCRNTTTQHILAITTENARRLYRM